MSIMKAMKGVREVLKVAVFRKGPRFHLSKQPAPKLLTYDRHSSTSHSYTTHLGGKFLRALFSRAATLLSRYNIKHLQPRNRGVSKFGNIPVFSLIGVGFGLDSVLDTKMNSTALAVRDIFKDYRWEAECFEANPHSLGDLDINMNDVIGKGCEGAVFEAKLRDGHGTEANLDARTDDGDYNLAIKAIFNYGAESNASSILRELKREMVPLQPTVSAADHLCEIMDMNFPQLPPHPNVVDLLGVFVDVMLVTEQGQREFPAAMPRRVNPDICFGRNKTLYLVMRKCTTKLSDFMTEDVSMTTRCFLLTQLLEAVHHMTSHGVAHRDLKGDNILIDLSQSAGTPRLQVCDFGCCLAEPGGRLEIPFVSSDVNMGGNSLLMAPEISCAKPGEGSVLDFRGSDLWACGALAYQILGAENPFYPNRLKQLKSGKYTEDELPPLPENVPAPIRKLVRSLLARDPTQRPSPSMAVLVVQMVLWESASRRRRQTTRKPHRVVMSKAKAIHAHVHYANKATRKMGLILAEMFALLQKLMSQTSLVSQDWAEVSSFLCLSRLTPSDFVGALKFFH